MNRSPGVGIQLPCVEIHDKLVKVLECLLKRGTMVTRQAVRCDVSLTVASDPRAGEGTKICYQPCAEAKGKSEDAKRRNSPEVRQDHR